MKIEQQETDWTPTRKVATGGIAGALGIIGVWVAGLFGLEVPPEVAAAAVTVLAFAASYIIPERS